MGAFVGLLIIGMLAPPSDNGTPPSEPAAPVPEQLTTLPLNEKVTPSYSSLPHYAEQEQTENINQYVEPANPSVRDTAALIVQDSPAGIDANSEAWKVWRINYWVTNNISYASDPKGSECFAYAHETLATKTGDCDDFAVLLSSMYESIGLDAAIAYIDTDNDERIDHVTCIIYYSKDSDSFLGEEKVIMSCASLTSPTGHLYVSYVAASSEILSGKYTTGIWIVADPLMADVKGIVGYVTHEPYAATSVIDVGSK